MSWRINSTDFVTVKYDLLKIVGKKIQPELSEKPQLSILEPKRLALFK